jgi:hypothetical protein
MPKPMDGAEYSRALKRLGFSNRFFCLHVIGVDDSTGRRWIAGDAVPGCVASLLRLSLKLKLDADQVRALLGLE